MDVDDGFTENPLLAQSQSGDADGRAGGSRGPSSLKRLFGLFFGALIDGVIHYMGFKPFNTWVMTYVTTPYPS